MPAHQESTRARSARHYLINGPQAARLQATLALVAESLGFPVARVNILDETQDSADRGRAAGCDYGQGFLWAQPLPARVIDGAREPGRPTPDQDAAQTVSAATLVVSIAR